MPKRFFSFDLAEPTLGVKRLTCYEPTNAHRPLTCPMISMLMKTFTSIAKEQQNVEKSNNEDVQLTHNEIINLLQIAPGQSSDFYYEFFDKFKALILSSNICMTDTNKGLDGVTFDNLLVSDTDKLLGTYVINFMMPSDSLTKAV